LKRKITEKWPAKVLSLVAAIILFIFHGINTLETRYFPVPLQIETNGIFNTENISQMINVKLRAEADIINIILEDDIEAFIDIKNFSTEGWYQIPVRTRKKGSAASVFPLLITVDPPDIYLWLEYKSQDREAIFQ
jgi:YbbR domain-containing protein